MFKNGIALAPVPDVIAGVPKKIKRVQYQPLYLTPLALPVTGCLLADKSNSLLQHVSGLDKLSKEMFGVLPHHASALRNIAAAFARSW